MNNQFCARIWVHSDLQLAEPLAAATTLAKAVDDLLELGLKLDAIWCLGDAHCGANEAALRAVAAINVAQLRRLNASVYYVLGNHEMDLTASGVRRFPLYELAASDTDWHMAALDEFYFCAEFCGFLVVFMGDHAAREGNWWTAHGYANGDDYPHTPASYEELRRRMRDYDGPVIIASHYALPGGQRPGPLMERLLPLPDNVRLHLHGHAHIGDLVWNKENPWQRENPITGDTRKQYNVSALETARTPGSHSTLLELYPDNSISLRIRCHLEKRWLEEFRIAAG
jgi:calcineurin-like phosphoesterase family protein